jgi:hypothetical protein
MFIGDAEESLYEFLEKYGTVMHTRQAKDAAKTSALSIEGVYVPEFYSVQYHGDGTIAGRTMDRKAPAKIKRRCLRHNLYRERHV